MIPRTLLATALALVLLPASAFADNLLANPSFEDAGDGNDRAANWLRWGQWINREDSWTPVRTGKAVIGYHHWRIESADDSVIWQDLTLPAGDYTFAVQANRDDAGASHLAAEVELRLEAVTEAGPKTIATAKTKVADIATGPTWTPLTVKGKSTGGVVRALIRIAPAKDAPRGGAVKLDDAELTATK